MGIFTKRKIQANEELTFNYNVDRYGHDAQVCHCGEPNCVGFIGGKTQTDIAGMDDLYLDGMLKVLCGLAPYTDIVTRYCSPWYYRGRRGPRSERLEEEKVSQARRRLFPRTHAYRTSGCT